MMLDTLARVRTSRHRYSDRRPSGLGGLPAPRCQPRLKGRNHDAFPRRCVQKWTSFSSTAKCATQRPNWKRGSRGLRSRLYCQDGVVEGLLREAVLELEGEDGQPVDEEPDVQRALSVVPAVAKLAGDAELVLAEAPLGRLVLGRGRAVEEVEVVGAVLDAVAEDGDGAVFGDLALEAGEELVAGGTVFVEAEGGGGVGLGGVEEGAELDEVDAVLAVVVVMVAGGPAYAAVGGGGFADGAAGGGSQGSPVRALQMRRSRPRSVRSVVMGGGPL